jgi:hypothetical protein
MRTSLAGLMAAAVGASALVAGVAAPTAAAADTKSNCYVQLKAPSTVKIDRHYQRVTVSLIDSCKTAEFAAIALYSSRGFEDGFVFDGRTTSSWNVYAGKTTLGTLKTNPDDSLAYDSDENEIAVKPTTIKVKLGSHAYVGAARKGSKVTVKASATSWDVKSEKYKAWNAGKATIQYQSGSSWKSLKTVKLKNGAASYSYSTKSTRTYRFVVGEDGTHFGATSSTARR